MTEISSNPGKRILIVDDEPILLKMLSMYLQRLGYDVMPVGNTETAWEAVQASPDDFAVAVLDATLKGIAMEDLASRMLAGNPRVRVIAASGYPVDISGLQACAPGRVMFLQKPFTGGGAEQRGAEDDCHARSGRLTRARK